MENKEVRLIDAELYRKALKSEMFQLDDEHRLDIQRAIILLDQTPATDPESLRPHGKWLLEAHKESTNYRWNVTAECSNCCDEKKEIWAGFFPNVPDWLARDVALDSASSVKLSNYCPNCGAKMDGEVE